MGRRLLRLNSLKSGRIGRRRVGSGGGLVRYSATAVVRLLVAVNVAAAQLAPVGGGVYLVEEASLLVPGFIPIETLAERDEVTIV